MPLFSPIIAYSFPSRGSVQPQESFPEPAFKSVKLRRDCKSYPSQGYVPAIPPVQGVCEMEINGISSNNDSKFFIMGVGLNMVNMI